MVTPVFELKRYLREQRRRGVITVPPINPTAEQERRFRRFVDRLIVEWTDIVNKRILPAYARAVPIIEETPSRIGYTQAARGGALGAIDREMEDASKRSARWIGATEPAIAAVAAQYAEEHRRKFIAVMSRAAKVDVQPFLSLSSAEFTVGLAVREFVALIKGLDAELRKKIELAVVESMQSRFAIRDLRKRLIVDLGFAPGRAKIIAQDQIGKYTVALDRLRHEQLGVEVYQWITMEDDKVRPTHVANHEKYFRWDKPPHPTGHPGHDINCRCRPRAVIDPEEVIKAQGYERFDPARLKRERDEARRRKEEAKKGEKE